ncbi:MAG TPA: nickel-binding protein, partial [Solirubrobacteraceae bacterium]|nr:nickel-binding protein [Solirubrobacteraceae bacterium]
GGELDSARRGGVQARRAAEQLSSEGTPVRYLHCLLVPEDETCFYLYEAAVPEAVDAAARRAGLVFERVSAAVSEPMERPS